MSSRHQKEKRLRPQRDPYKRDHFDQSKYLRVSASASNVTSKEDTEDFSYIDDEYDDVEV